MSETTDELKRAKDLIEEAEVAAADEDYGAAERFASSASIAAAGAMRAAQRAEREKAKDLEG